MISSELDSARKSLRRFGTLCIQFALLRSIEAIGIVVSLNVVASVVTYATIGQVPAWNANISVLAIFYLGLGYLFYSGVFFMIAWLAGATRTVSAMTVVNVSTFLSHVMLFAAKFREDEFIGKDTLPFWITIALIALVNSGAPFLVLRWPLHRLVSDAKD